MAIRTISDDDLRELSDDQLGRQIESMRRLARKRDSSFTRKVQTELCYLQREMDWRYKRRELHKIYMRNLKRNHYN
jgi:hypothetical protein